MKRRFLSSTIKVILSVALAAVPLLGGVQSAYADMGSRYWSAPTKAVSFNYKNVMKTYGVRAGSAGPDFLGISNTNFDFSSASPTSYVQTQYTNYSASDLNGVLGAGLAIWSTDMNENPNPFYTNLYYKSFASAGNAVSATTWVANPDSSSWGDSNNVRSARADGSYSINGLEYSPEIIFGANKYTNWSNADYSSTNIYRAAAKDSSYNPVFVNNDVTNAWSQIYSLVQLGVAAEQVKATTGQTTRYDNNNAITSAVNYEKSLRGNLLYVASQIDTGNAEKKTVAYLYAIKNGIGYFFIPEASGLTSGNDTGDGTSLSGGANQTVGEAIYNAGLSSYGGNNATIDLDYLGVLPFITNTFTGGKAITGGILMEVEDIWKSNPGVYVSSSDTTALKDVDVIIYNSSVNTDLQGTSGGKNSSGINNSFALTDSVVSTWAKNHGFDTTSGLILAGSDYGTSSNQGFGTKATTETGMAPLLYCQRNYTADKAARIAWAFSKVYPELYPNEDASYGYWVDTVYHVKTSWVKDVVAYMTNQSDTVTYTAATARAMEDCFAIGLDWWLSTGSSDPEWSQYAYYNGSSRASYYSGNGASAEPGNLIGIFQPTQVWLDAVAAAGVDTTELSEEIENAQSTLGSVAPSVDGSDVFPLSNWVEKGVYDELASAIDLAKETLEDASATQVRVNAMVSRLQELQSAFKDAIAPGTATASTTEITPGLYLVRYAPTEPIQQGSATFAGQTMVWNETGKYWALILSEIPAADAVFAEDVATAKVTVGAPKVAGDVNGNGRYNIVDVQVIYDVATNKYAYTSDRLELWLLSEVNGDGVVDAVDAHASMSTLLRG